MTDIAKFNQVECNLIVVRDQQVILNHDVAVLYGVKNKEINQAVKNNPDKFPSGYVFELMFDEWESLRSKKLTLKSHERGKHTKYLPTAFTEKGLYMLATIIRSKKATQATIEIIETFAKVREFSRTLSAFTVNPEKEERQNLIKKGTDILSEIIGEELEINSTETSIELNLAVLKLKHTVKRK